MTRKLLAEAAATFFVTIVAIGVDVAYFGGHGADFASRWLARAFVTAAAIYAFSELSGAHVSPAVTIGFALRRVFPWGRAAAYVGAQFAGALLASLVGLVAYGAALFDGASHPGPGVTPFAAFAFEVLASFLVMCVILLTAENKPAVGKQAAIAVGLAVGACGFFAGPISGASMNPARSIVPLLLAGHPEFAWIYAAGPLAGAAAAVALQYALCGAPSAREREAAKGE